MAKSRPTKPQAAKSEPVYSVSSVFAAHRDLKHYVKAALGDAALSVEEADILVFLLGLKEFGWTDCAVDPDGFVTFKSLKGLLVHDASLVARRIKKLASPAFGMVEAKRIKKKAKPGLHGNSQHVRITPAGIAAVKPVWERFSKLSAKLFALEPLKSMPRDDLNAHIRVNEAISKVLRELRDPAEGLH